MNGVTHQKDIGTEGWIPAFCCIFLISAALWPQTEPSGIPMRAHMSAGMGSLGMPTSARERQCQHCVQRGQAGRIRTRAHDIDAETPKQCGTAARGSTPRLRNSYARAGRERPASVLTYRHQQKAAHHKHTTRDHVGRTYHSRLKASMQQDSERRVDGAIARRGAASRCAACSGWNVEHMRQNCDEGRAGVGLASRPAQRQLT